MTQACREIPFRAVSRLTSVVLLGSFLAMPRVHAAFTDHFDALAVELAARAPALIASTDKAEQKQGKACLRSIAAIEKASDSLAKDIKTGSKVAGALEKAFPDEVGVVVLPADGAAAGAAPPTLQDLLIEAFLGLGGDVDAAADALEAAAGALPDGSVRTKAEAALAAARSFLDAALDATDFRGLAKSLGQALKAAERGQKTAARGGGGGGGGDGLRATITIGGGTPMQFVADAAGAEWVQGPGILDIGGSRGNPLNSQLSVALCSGFNGATGEYTLGNNCGGFTVFTPFAAYLATSGTLTITRFDANRGLLQAAFSLMASDGTTTVSVTGGRAMITNLIVTTP